MRLLRATSIGLAAATAMAVGVFASPAKADWHDGHRHWERHGWYRPWGPPVVVAAPPYYYAPPPAYYAPPPPVVYAPPPTYYSPGVSFGFSFR